MYGAKTVRLFEEVKDRFDPNGLMNPGKIVRASRMDDRSLFRFKPDYRVPGDANGARLVGLSRAGGGFQGAVEMCNNNGECRKHAANVMCPSFRVTGNERDVTRGRANALRLAISGQLGPDALRLRRHAGDDEAVRLLQGLPARVPHRRRHGQDEDRGAGGGQRAPRAVLARPAGRLSAPLRALCVAPGAADECARCHPRCGVVNRAAGGSVCQAASAALAARRVPRAARELPSPSRRRRVFDTTQGGAGGPTGGWRSWVHPTPNPSPSRGGEPGGGVAACRLPRGRAVRRHVQHLLRAREPARRHRGARPSRLPRHGAALAR